MPRIPAPSRSRSPGHVRAAAAEPAQDSSRLLASFPLAHTSQATWPYGSSPDGIPVSDLFAPSAADWDRDPLSSFDGWLVLSGFKSSSADVYRTLWRHFAEHLSHQHLRLSQATPSVINGFLARLEANRPHKARYLRVIERVLDHIARSADAPAGSVNVARGVAVRMDAAWREAGPNRPMGFLTPEERHQVQGHLEQRLWALKAEQICAWDDAGTPLRVRSGMKESGSQEGVRQEPRHKARKAAGGLASGAAQQAPGIQERSHEEAVREARDLVLCGAYLYGGIKVGEAQGLTVSCAMLGEEWLLVEAADPRYSRRLPLTPLLRALLEHWLVVRAAAGTLGRLMFPSDASGRPMHKATCLRAIDALMRAAGLPAEREERASPQTLRNTYGATLLDAGNPDGLVAERLGFDTLVTAHRFRDAWLAWQVRTGGSSP